MSPPLGPPPTRDRDSSRPALLRVLGTIFGWAVTVGSMIGAGILRAPGDVAQATTSVTVFFALWLAGALYALLGALSLAELGAMIPESGGQTVFVRRAFGAYPGFAVGWSDWISTCAAVAAVAIVLAESLGAVLPLLVGAKTMIASAVVLLLMSAHWRGVRTSGSVQTLTSALKALAFAALVAACFGAAGTYQSAPRAAPALGLIVALQAVIYTYDGWTAPLYFSGEVKQPGRDIPRSMLAGMLSVMVIYLLVNAAFLAVLGLDGMAGSMLVADDVAQIVFGAAGTSVIRTLIVVSLVSAVSANLLMGTRVIYALGRLPRFGFVQAVNAGGTPTSALALSTAVAIAFALTGAFERVIALAAFFFVANYATSFLAVFWLRRREPETARPYRAFGYPFSTGIALLGSLAFLISAVMTDALHSAVAIVLLALSYPAYRWLGRST